MDTKDAANKFSLFFASSVLLYQIIFMAVFAGIFYTQYQSTLASRWLSPANASQDGQLCDPVYKTVDGSYLIDRKGNWQSSPNFDDSTAIYHLKFTNAMLSHDDYVEALAKIEKKVRNLGQVTAINQDLSWTLVMYASFFQKIHFPKQGYMQFFLTGDAAVIFGESDGTSGLIAQSAAIGDDTGNICIPPATMKPIGVALAGSDLSISIPIESTATLLPKHLFPVITTTGPCPNIFDIRDNFGYEPPPDDASANSFEAKVDMRSVSTAIAINAAVINATDLQEVNTAVKIPGTNYVYRTFVDPYYPTMASINCITTANNNNGVGFLCGVQTSASSNTFFPFIKHTGYSPPGTAICWTTGLYECTQYAMAVGKDNGACDTNRLSFSFLFSKKSDFYLYDQLYKAGYLTGSRLYTLIENTFPASSMISDAMSIYQSDLAVFKSINGSSSKAWQLIVNNDPPKLTTKSPSLAPLAAGTTLYPSNKPVTKAPLSSGTDDAIKTDDTYLTNVGLRFSHNNNVTSSPSTKVQNGNMNITSGANPWLQANFYASGDSHCSKNTTGTWSIASRICQSTPSGSIMVIPFIYTVSPLTIAVQIATYSDPYCFNLVSADISFFEHGVCSTWPSSLFLLPGVSSAFTVYAQVFYSQTPLVPLPKARGPLVM